MRAFRLATVDGLDRKGHAVVGMYTSFSLGYCDLKQNSDHCMNFVTHREHFVHHRRVAAETLDPILVTEHEYGGAPGCSSSGEGASKERLIPKTSK